jgi:hypothetical protein
MNASAPTDENKVIPMAGHCSWQYWQMTCRDPHFIFLEGNIRSHNKSKKKLRKIMHNFI